MIRSILFSKALTTDDLELSRQIMTMLASSGNAAVDLIRENRSEKHSFDILWKVLAMDDDETVATLISEAGMDESKAREACELIHPKEKKEIFLIILLVICVTSAITTFTPSHKKI